MRSANNDDDDDDDDSSSSERSSPRSPPSTTPRPCHCCHRVVTTKRCTGCGFCPMCSLECEHLYSMIKNGPAACCYHKITNAVHQTSQLDEECLGDLMGGPMAIMGGTVTRHTSQEALPTIVQFIVDQLHLNESNAPLTMHSHVAGTLVPVGDSSWSRAMLRIGHIPTKISGTSPAVLLDEEHRASARLLASAGQLAVAQNRSSAGACSQTKSDLGHAFVLARVVRLPPALGASFSYGLQVDLILASKIRHMNGETLDAKRYGGGMRSAVAVYKLDGSLHEDSGYPIFKFPGASARNHILLSKELSHRLEPLLPHRKVQGALNLQVETSAAMMPPPPPRAPL